MDELVEGDNTHTGGKVFMFTHHDPYKTTEFVRMETSEFDCKNEDDGHGFLEITPGHYVYVNDRLIPARDVRVGDWLRKSGENGSNSFTASVRVVQVQLVVKQGVYNPQTVTGDISVNGFVVSTYTEAIDPNAAHSLLAPLRMIYYVFNKK